MEYRIAAPQGRRVRRKTERPVFSRSAFLFLFALFLGGFLHGQTAADMDKLLDSREVTWAQACRFVLPAAGALGENAGAGAAFAAARDKGWLPKGAAAEGPVKLGQLSFLILQSFSIEKSFLCALFPGPRYTPEPHCNRVGPGNRI
jgi:hypothetical protein